MTQVREHFLVPSHKEIYYIDISTNGIGTPQNTSVSGTKTNFIATIQPLVLDPNKHYFVELVSVRYRNNSSGRSNPGNFLAVLADIGENIRVNDSNSSIIFIGSEVLGQNNRWIHDTSENNFSLKLPLRTNIINTISVQLLASMDGTDWPFQSASYPSMTFKIESA